ncbi:Hsp20/alpha crystallin family protein [Halobacteriovorax sp. DA5]|uniref:Hsp20/alpha crystallin family protein n=1 Tax=Halobacteriovorax sp. DA5 TaxID=2067553 RepID=UPI000CD24F31|nr:Hsp20/alpha crystallin family protein [Halobacteriovorax sp. DA5]POB14349.1 hypothetical protein C0Z22_04455 [Halobacteriovorax sp. DA5]
MKKIICITFFLLSVVSYGQTNDPLVDQITQMRDEMFKQMQAGDSFDAEIQKMFERLQKLGQIKGLPDRFNRHVNMVEYFWQDADTLVIKISKDDEVNVEVKENIIVISGQKVIKSPNGISKSSFSQSIPLRANLDSTSVKMSMKDGNIVMDFRPLKKSKQR